LPKEIQSDTQHDFFQKLCPAKAVELSAYIVKFNKIPKKLPKAFLNVTET
jgi:hypothetical protein